MTGVARSISVIIPHYNDLANLDRCLENLHHQSVAADVYEIVVADNNSTCDRQALEAICAGRARLVDAPIQGAAAARNTGIAAAGAPLLALIDSDCRPAADWLAQGLSALADHDLVGGEMNVSVQDRHALSAAEAFELVFAFNNARYVREENFSVTANMFLRRSVFDRVGGFRGGVSEDLDWGRRAVAMGYRWYYAPQARVEHPARRDWSELHRKWRRILAETFALFQEGRKTPAVWLLRNWLAFIAFPLELPKILRSQKLTTLSDKLQALGMLIRLRCWRLGAAHRLALGAMRRRGA